jgi:hypothetical protein
VSNSHFSGFAFKLLFICGRHSAIQAQQENILELLNERVKQLQQHCQRGNSAPGKAESHSEYRDCHKPEGMHLRPSSKSPAMFIACVIGAMLREFLLDKMLHLVELALDFGESLRDMAQLRRYFATPGAFLLFH